MVVLVSKFINAIRFLYFFGGRFFSLGGFFGKPGLDQSYRVGPYSIPVDGLFGQQARDVFARFSRFPPAGSVQMPIWSFQTRSAAPLKLQLKSRSTPVQACK
jgi:hypothetical protein